VSEPETVSSIVAASSEVLVGPNLVPIYCNEDGEAEPQQIGTAFILQHAGARILVTAAHCLFGQSKDQRENAGDKLVFQGGGLQRLGDLTTSELVSDPHHDLAAVVVRGFEVGISEDALKHAHEHTSVIALHGYLGRDFKRDRTEGLLRPKPFIYQNAPLNCLDGKLRFKFPRKNLDTFSNARVMAPIPRGLSGGPILDAIALAQGKIGIAGVFTEWDAGVGSGASREVLVALLQRLCSTSQDPR
jgi:hypothetical protein